MMVTGLAFLFTALTVVFVLILLGLAYYIPGKPIARYIRNQLRVKTIYSWILAICILSPPYYLLRKAWINTEWSRRDSCLDFSGCWDSIDHVCRRDEKNAQELCDRKL